MQERFLLVVQFEVIVGVSRIYMCTMGRRYTARLYVTLKMGKTIYLIYLFQGVGALNSTFPQCCYFRGGFVITKKGGVNDA